MIATPTRQRQQLLRVQLTAGLGALLAFLIDIAQVIRLNRLHWADLAWLVTAPDRRRGPGLAVVHLTVRFLTGAMPSARPLRSTGPIAP